MKKLILTVIVVTLGFLVASRTLKAKESGVQREAASALAQKNAAQALPHSPFSTSACSFTFTSGQDDSFLKYCVTANGNITQIETPAGKEHIAVGAFGEGYGICDLNPFVKYFDYADFGDSGNWGPASVVSQNSTTVKIARTTSDGIWTLTQTISRVSGTTPSIKLAMALKNNTPQLRTVFLIRYADVDAAGAVHNNLDGTAKSAFAWNSNATSIPFGLMLQNAGPFPVEAQPAGFTQTVASGPDPCLFFNNFATGTQIGADGSIAMLYGLNLPKGAAKSVTMSYKGL